MQKTTATATSDINNTHAETAEFNQKTLILIIFSGAQNGVPQNGWKPLTSPYPCTQRKVVINEKPVYSFFRILNSDLTEPSSRARRAEFRTLCKIARFVNFAKLSQSYDQNKFLIVFIKENEAFFDKKQA